MANQIDAWLVGGEWARVQDEMNRFLKAWWFSISDTGVIYARPTLPTLTPGDLSLFLRRLRLICDESYSGTVILDFCDLDIPASELPQIQDELDCFAAEHGARLVSREFAQGCVYSLAFHPGRSFRKFNAMAIETPTALAR